MKRAGRGDHVGDFECADVAVHDEPWARGTASARLAPHAAAQRCVYALRVILEEPNHFVLVSDAVGIIALVSESGQANSPVRELEHQRIPSLASPTLADPAALQDDMGAAKPAQVCLLKTPKRRGSLEITAL
jgi:hypothetical protein